MTDCLQWLKKRHADCQTKHFIKKKGGIKILPIQKILCPTDFSEPSYVGLQKANELAVHFSSQLLLVHVVPHVHFVPTQPGGAGLDLPTYLEEMVNGSRNLIAEVAEKRLSPDLEVRTTVLQGEPADQIVELAGDEKVDMIVTSTHGLTGWRRFIFGSVAEKVVRFATCPVLTVPAPHEEG